jgi:hypothetical protein
LGTTLYKCLKGKETGKNIVGFLDRKAAGRQVEGLRVVNPFAEPVDKTNAVVVVSVFNRDIDFLAVREQLQSIGFNEVVSMMTFYPHCAGELGDWYWLSSNKDYLHNEQDFRVVYSMLSDEKSREVFSAVIKARKEGRYELLPEKSPMEEQYFPKDVPLQTYETFIDGGAYDGDTFDSMERHGVSSEYYYAFEPDLSNFAKLSNNMKGRSQKAVLFPCGVFSQTTLLRFAASGGENASIQPDGAEVISCVALDDVLININDMGGG